MQEWNRQRTLAIERSLTQFLYPQMAKELKSKLIAEAKENIVRVMGRDVITDLRDRNPENIRNCWIMFYLSYI